MSENSLFRKAEFAANMSIVVVALLLSIVLVRGYLLTKSSPPVLDREAAGSSEIHVGQALALPDVDWAKNGQTLILALSTTCHFCTESGPFYQRVAKERAGTRLIALMPQSVEESRQYLNKLGIEVSEVRQSQTGALGVTGTPTLILVNNEGAVINSWVGRLPAEKEAEVLSNLK
jgi:thioredoxin-related protein